MKMKKPKSSCCYCYDSRLSDDIFESVLIAFLLRYPANKLERALRRKETPLSEKTIRRYYKKIGEHLFDVYVLPNILQVAGAQELYQEEPEIFESWLHQELPNYHNMLMREGKGLEYSKNDREIYVAMRTYRELSKSKYGVRDSIKQNMGLAFFWQHAEETFGRHKKGAAPSESIEMFKEISTCCARFLLKKFKAQPL